MGQKHRRSRENGFFFQNPVCIPLRVVALSLDASLKIPVPFQSIIICNATTIDDQENGSGATKNRIQDRQKEGKRMRPGHHRLLRSKQEGRPPRTRILPSEGESVQEEEQSRELRVALVRVRIHGMGNSPGPTGENLKLERKTLMYSNMCSSIIFYHYLSQ